MYGQLGDITFDLLFGPSTDVRSFGKKFAVHPKINGKDRLQSTGTELEKIDLTIKLNAAFCNPQEELDRIKLYNKEGKVLKYISGTGVVFGNFVIESGKANVKKTFPDGTLRSVEMDLSLLEYYIGDKKLSASQQARKFAYAIDVAQPRPINFVPNIDNNITLAGMQDVQAMNSSVSTITQIKLAVENAADFAETASGKVTEAADKGQQAIVKLQTKISDSQALADMVMDLPNRLDDLNTNYQNIINLMPITNTPQGLAAFYQATIETKSAMSFVNYAASPMAAFAGWRGTF